MKINSVDDLNKIHRIEKITSESNLNDIKQIKENQNFVHLEIQSSDIIPGNSESTFFDHPYSAVKFKARKMFMVSDFVTYKDRFLKKRFNSI